MSKQYKLLKDLPGAPAGTIFTYCEPTKKYLCPLKSHSESVMQMPKWIVEQCDDWFERVPEDINITIDPAARYWFHFDLNGKPHGHWRWGHSLIELLHSRK